MSSLHHRKNISGICVILIGPVDGARHCDPEPGYLEVFIFHKKGKNILLKKLQSHPDWELQSSFSLRAEDEISVYRRSAGGGGGG